MDQSNYSETIRFRCLREYYPNQTEDIYLTLCGVEQCTPDKERVDRPRDGYHLHVILSGQGVLETDQFHKELGAGEMFLVKPGERIAYWPSPEDPWFYCWMSFNGAKAANYMREAGFTDGVYTLNCNAEPGHFFQLCDHVLNLPQLTASAAFKRLGLLLEFIGLAIESSERGLRNGFRREYQFLYHKGEYVGHAIDFIQNNYASITVADVAEYLGIDRSYFSSIFRQSQGISPNEYLLRVRMRASSHMLLNMSMSIQDIARHIGYEDSLTFSKAFKRFFGVSPKYYREMPVDARPELDAVIAARSKKAQRE